MTSWFKGHSRKLWLLSLLGLALTVVAAWHATQTTHSQGGFAVLNALERDAYDWRLRMTAPAGIDPRVVIVDIDEQSLQKAGQWPWSRAQIAQLVETLFDRYHIDTLGFDIVFAEPETHYSHEEFDRVLDQAGGLLTPEQLKSLMLAQQGDRRLAAQLDARSTVLGYFFEKNTPVDSVSALPESLFGSELSKATQAPQVQRYSGNIPILQQAAPNAGFFSLASVSDPDGIIRRVALLNQFQGRLYGALPLMVAQQFTGSPIEPKLAASEVVGYPGLEALDLGIAAVLLDAQAAVLVPYRQPGLAFEYVPAWQVLEGRVAPAALLDGAIVLLGTSAAGLVDLRNTPLQNGFPGVEIHATLVAALLDGQFRSQPAWTMGFEFISVVSIGLLLSLLLPRLSIAQSTLLAFGVTCLVLVLNWYFWVQALWVVPIATVAVLIWLLYSFNTLLGFFAEARSRKIMRQMFGLYVPAEIVDEMSATPDVYSLQSEKREMTVMFSDVRGFTTISEQLSPEALSELLNTLLTPITQIIHHNHGAIDKYMGDAVMAFWGAPEKTTTHAEDAVRAALAISNKLKEINQDFVERGWPEMQMGIGISTGPMSVGNMGSEFRMAYTVLGDRVNLGSRLEGLTKQYGVDVVVSEATTQAARQFIYRELDRVRVKGKQAPERIFEPLAAIGELDEQRQVELSEYEQALGMYQRRQWSQAEQAFQALHSQFPRDLYGLYAQRSVKLSLNPPVADWDGVTTLVNK